MLKRILKQIAKRRNMSMIRLIFETLLLIKILIRILFLNNFNLYYINIFI